MLVERGVGGPAVIRIESHLEHARRRIDQVDQRLLKGETIPQNEKVFSIFEEHTRWCVKGKTGVPVELGVPVAVLEDQHGFLLHHRILWEGSDVDHAVPVIREAQARFPDLRLCSFDKGFHSPSNRVALDALLDHNVLAKKGKLSRADREREAETTFREMRRQHPAVGAAINNLEQRGMDRVLILWSGRLCADGGAVHGSLQCPPHRAAAAQGSPGPVPTTTKTRRLTAARQ